MNLLYIQIYINLFFIAVKPCSDPGFSMNGLRKGDCCLRGNIASYTCNEGFEMVGEQDIECLLSTRWSYPRPLCRRKCFGIHSKTTFCKVLSAR